MTDTIKENASSADAANGSPVSEHSRGDGILKRKDGVLMYTMDSRPPITVTVFAAIQHILIALLGLLSIPFVIADSVCASYDDPIRTKIFASTMFACGICTILQTLVGVRLPILQGPSAGFIIVLLAVGKTDEWQCVDMKSANATMVNATEPVARVLSQEERLRQLSGTVMAGSLLEILIGGTGLVGWLLRYVGPITVAPVISLIGLSFYKVPIKFSMPSWELALAGVVLVLVFSLYIGHIKIPLRTPANCRKPRGKTHGSRLFQILPVLFSMIIVWTIAAILTYTDVFPNDPEHPRFKARVDAKAKQIELTPWFYFPYPGQFGMPSFNVAIFIGFIAVYIAVIIESVGDYFAAAKSCQVAPPPKHAVTRGIFVEGIGALICGAIGIGHASTSYTPNIGAMALTKTANRQVMVCAGVIMIVLSMIGKFGGALATIPDPVIGGVIIVLIGMMVSVGVAPLKHVNMDSSRNLLILGTAIFSGILIPEWIDRYPKFFKTGNKEFDNILLVVLGTPMFVGGVIALFLDNTARGSREDRGIDAWRHTALDDSAPENTSIKADSTSPYGWFFQDKLYKILPCCGRLPFMPPRDVSASYELNNVSPKTEP